MAQYFTKKQSTIYNQSRSDRDQQSISSGFTLIELLVVIAVIGSLSALFIGNTVQQADRARDAQRLQDIGQIKNAIEVFYHDTNCYPATIPASGAWTGAGGTVYMQKVPRDPKDGSSYVYATDSTSSCPQWMMLFSKLSRAQTSAKTCSLPDYIMQSTPPACGLPTEFNASSYGCVSSGNITCHAPAPTAIPTNPPTATPPGGFSPTPKPTATPTPPAMQLVEDADHDGYSRLGENPGPHITTGQSTINGRIYYSTTTSGGAYNYISQSAALGGGDCDDTNANTYQYITNLAMDADHDGYYTGSPDNKCVGSASTSQMTGKLAAFYRLDEGSGTSTTDISGFGNNGKSNSAFGLQGWWKFDETTGTTASDSSGNNLTTEPVVGTIGAAGKYGNAVALSGSNQYVQVNNNSVLNPTRQITITGWFKANNLSKSWQSIFYKGNSPECPPDPPVHFGTDGYGCSNRQYAMFLYNDGSLYLDSTSQTNVGVGQTVCPTVAGLITAGQWYEFAGVINSDTGIMQIYVNGVLQATSGVGNCPYYSTNGIRTTTAPFYIGYNPSWDTALNGSVDDFRVYNRALTASEIATMYSTTTNGLAGYWQLDDGFGTSAADVSGNANTGTLIDSKLTAWWKFDEPTATNATDASGNNKTGTVSGTSVVSGKIGNYARNFANNADTMTIPSISLNGVNYTIATWFQYPLAAGTGWNTLTRGTSADHQVIVRRSDLQLGVYDSATGFHGCGFIMSTLSSAWHHLAAVGSGTSTVFYMDGVQICTSNFKSNSDIYSVGNYQGGTQQFGVIDDTRIYTRALSAGEISGLYNNNSAGPVWSNSPKVGANALSFNGTSNYISVPSNGSLNMTGGNFTIGAWINPSPSSTSNGALVTKGNSGEEYIFEYGLGGIGRLAFLYKGAWRYSTVNPVTTGSWQHVAVTVTGGSTVTFYYNGSQTGASITGISGTYGPTLTGELDIGRQGPTCNCNFFQGGIDDVQVYNRALTQDEVSAIYSNTGSPRWVIGHSVNALSFNGLNDMVGVPDSSSLRLGANQSVAAWVNWNGGGSGYQRIVGKGGTNVRNYGLWIAPGNGTLFQMTDGGINPSCQDWYTTPPTTGWNYLVGTYDGTTARLYINGNRVLSADCNMTFPLTTDPLMIGLFPGNTSFSGIIDDVRLYNRTLSDAEVSALYALNPGGMVGHWGMDESTGQGVADVSGNGANGTATGTSIVAGHSADSGNARSFNGTSDYVLMNQDTGTFGSLTVSMWVKRNGAGVNWPRLFLNTTVNTSITITETGSSSDGGLLFRLVNGGGARIDKTTPAGTLDDGTWKYLTFVWDGSNMYIYVNGVAQGSPVSFAGPLYPVAAGYLPVIGGESSAHIGGVPASSFNGVIDDVQVYNRALTATEISQLYSPNTSGRVAYWKMDETKGTTVADSSGSNSGTATGTSIVSGALNNARSFNGTSDYVNLGTDASLRQASISVGAWIKASSSQTAYPQIISNSTTSTDGYNLYLQNGAGLGQAAFILKDNNAWGQCYAVGGPNLKDNFWHYVVGVYNGSSVQVYVDGSLVATDSSCTGLISYGDLPRGEIGRNQSGLASAYFNGSIDDVQIYNRALTAADISYLANQGPSSGGIAKMYYEDSSGKFSQMSASDTLGGNDVDDSDPTKQ